MKKFLVILLLSSVVLAAQQQSGTPNSIRVKTDANGYLVTTSLAQTLPLSQPIVFSNTRLRTDASGYLVVTLGTGSSIPAGGSNTQVQFNDSGVLNGDSGFVVNKTTDIINILGGMAAGTLAAPPTGVVGYFTTTSASDPRGLMTAQYSTDAIGARLHFRKGRGTEATPTTIVTADVLGRIRFSGYDGSNYLQMASIDAVSTGTIASTRVPTYLAFSTGTDAAPSVLTERLRVDSSITSTVPFQAPNGAVATPSYSGTGANADSGWYFPFTDWNGVSAGTLLVAAFNSAGLQVRSDRAIEFSTGTVGSASDVSISRLAADSLALRRTTNTQTLTVGPAVAGNATIVGGGGYTTTSTDGATLANLTAATAGVPVQISPRLRLRGTAWDTAASQTLDWFVENLPATAATPTSTLKFGHSLNGAAATYPLTVTSGGQQTLLGGLSVGGNQAINFAARASIVSPADGVLSPLNNAATIAASIIQRDELESVTTTKTPTALESNETYYSGDADGSIVTALNDPPTLGIRYNFLVTATQTSNNFQFVPNTGESIIWTDGTTCTIVSATAIGSSWVAMVTATGSGGKWQILRVQGTVACTP